MSPLSHSPSPDQLPLLCTPLVFATYHALYGTCTAMLAPTIAFVLISPVHRDEKGQTEYTPPYASHFVPLPHACAHTLSHACAHTLPLARARTSPHACTCTLPPFSLLPVHTPSSFIRLYNSLIQHSFTHLALSLLTPLSYYTLLYALHLHSLDLCTYA